MPNKTTKDQPDKDIRISLSPLTTEQALAGLLSIPDPDKTIADAAKPKRKGRPAKKG